MIVSAIALAGGGARATTGSCGAFSGGLMALSTRFCPRSEELADKELAELEKARHRFYEFRDWFIKEFSGVSCSDVLLKFFGRSYNLRIDKERDELTKLQKELGFNCGLVVEKVAIRIAEMLASDA